MRRNRPRTEAEIERDRKRCLNGVRKMTPEEYKERKKKYLADVKANPFRREQYAKYFRKRREAPAVRERINAQARARYHANIERERERARRNQQRIREDPEKLAAHNARRRARKYGPDGKMTAAQLRIYLNSKLIPRWESVVADGREEAYLRRTTPENARLFTMWRFNRVMFDEMMKSSYKRKARP